MNVPDEYWMRRCFDLARQGIGAVSPNPPVGAVLVHQERLLSEGYHTHFGGPHAEVMAIRNVPEDKKHLIRDSTLYVSLEPCCVTGKTPPCTDLILREGIRDVRISATDPNPQVSGKGLALLASKGISVKSGILVEEGNDLIRSFRTNILLKRPFVLLKWAQSKYGMLGKQGEQLWLSHPRTSIFSHRLRAEHDAILAGARTVETDDPSLTTREYPGRSPHRVIYDPESKLDERYRAFAEDGCRVFYFSKTKNNNLNSDHIHQFKLKDDTGHAAQILLHLYAQQIGNIIVEGGSHTLQLFIRENLWDEAWVIQTPHELAEGIKAPVVRGQLIGKLECSKDRIVGIKQIKDL
jgi:diaminohydroxyphosphoribosylaminopyrimidine deaminase/5-amino-6-(5-phosphoribosylamino)uracil reductase